MYGLQKNESVKRETLVQQQQNNLYRTIQWIVMS